MFFFNEIVPVTGYWLLAKGLRQMKTVRRVDNVALECNGGIINNPKLCGQDHRFEPAYHNYVCAIPGLSTKWVFWQED